MSTFSLSAPPLTDIWRKPPTKNAFNAPVTQVTAGKTLKSFKRAQLTFSFQPTVQYDQAGLLLHLSKPGQECHSADSISSDSELHKSCKWLKTGIELYDSQQRVSTVGCDNYADWSVVPLAAVAPGAKEITIEATRSNDENGKGLWVYQHILDSDGKVKETVPLREVAWFFALEDEGWEIGVAAMVCRPKEAEGELNAEFKNFQVEFGD